MSVWDTIPKADLYDCGDVDVVTCTEPAEALELWLNVHWDPGHPDRDRSAVVRENAPAILHGYHREGRIPDAEIGDEEDDEEDDELYDRSLVGQVKLSADDIEAVVRAYRGQLPGDPL